MYISERLGKPAPKMDVAAIGRIMGTNRLGTQIQNFLLLNRHRMLRRAIPSLKFELDYSYPRFTVIVKELEANRPVIVYIDLSDEFHDFNHAVVVTGYDEATDAVYYNDPMFGEKNEDQSWFIEKWEKVDRVLVKIKIGEKLQRQLGSRNIVTQGGKRRKRRSKRTKGHFDFG